MAANDLTPYFTDDDRVTCRASGAVTGKRAVMVAGDRVDDLILVGVATAGAKCFGIAGRDAASGADVLVYHEGIVPVTAAASITAGDSVKATSIGKATPASTGDLAFGVALEDNAGSGDVMVAFGPHTVGAGTATVTGDQAAVADVATADADGTYGSPEATLINELKTQVNLILARLRTAGIIVP